MISKTIEPIDNIMELIKKYQYRYEIKDTRISGTIMAYSYTAAKRKLIVMLHNDPNSPFIAEDIQLTEITQEEKKMDYGASFLLIFIVGALLWAEAIKFIVIDNILPRL